MNALNLKDISKNYKDFKALKNVSLKVEVGDFFALLGSNGAGKTTMIGIICGLLKSTTGELEVFDFNQKTHVNDIKKLVGLMPQEFNFDIFKPVEEILIDQAGYYGISRLAIKPRVEELLKEMQLWDKRKGIARELSGGMKRRLMLARAIIHSPKLLILDEPTAGVDVEIRRSIWQYLEKINKQGVTIILTTHYLEEAEYLCKNIALLKEGQIVKQSSMKKLLSEMTTQQLVLDSKEILPEKIILDNLVVERIDDLTLSVELPHDMSLNNLFTLLSKQNIVIHYIHNKQNRLESLFYE
jgi:ABC-2 type transport system ATP-binding protein